MSRYVANRLFQGIIALLVASILVFGLSRLTGNPAYLLAGEDASLEDIAMLTKSMGLDRPLPEQFWIFISHAVIGDFGNSLYYRGPVIDFIVECAPTTLKLTGLAVLFSLLISIPAGVLGALKRDRWPDTMGKIFAVGGQSVPVFWFGIVLIQLFAVQFGWLPAGGTGDFKYWILPALTLGYQGAAGIMRFTRSAMIDVLGTDYVRLARIKGVAERFVIWKHALRNALIPIVTFFSMTLARWLMGTVIVETVFSLPGLGRLSYQAVMHRDFPMMQGLILLFVGVFIFVNLVTDILYCYFDPRVRYVTE